MLGHMGKQTDELIGRLIGLARATEGNEHMITPSTGTVVAEGLLALGREMDEEAFRELLDRVTEAKRKLVPDCFLCACPCGRTDDHDMKKLWQAEETIRNLRLKILSAIRELADGGAEARLLFKGLIAIGIDEFGQEELLSILEEIEAVVPKG